MRLLNYVNLNYVNPVLSLGAYSVFFELTVFSITVFAVCSAVTFAFVISSNNSPVWGWGTPFPPCPFTSLSFAFFTFSVFRWL